MIFLSLLSLSTPLVLSREGSVFCLPDGCLVPPECTLVRVRKRKLKPKIGFSAANLLTILICANAAWCYLTTIIQNLRKLVTAFVKEAP